MRTTGLAALLLAVALGHGRPACADVVVYPRIPGRPLSTTFEMTVDGRAVPVHRYGTVSFAWFAFSGTADVKVTVKEAVTSYVLSPQRNAVPSSVAGRDVAFRLTQPRKLVLHKVNRLSDELFVFADALETDPPKPGAPGVFDVRRYGASPGGGDSTRAIQRAIDAAAASPTGGVAYVPPGVYDVTASLVLKSRVHLYLAAGAVVRVRPGTYVSRVVFPISRVEQARISGRGVIDGRAIDGEQSYEFLMHTNQADKLQIEDIMFLDGKTTALRIAASTNSRVSNVKVLSGSPNLSDGIDLDGDHKITLANSFVYSSDDSVAITSGTNSFSYGIGAPTENIRITGNVFHHPSSGYCCYGHIVSVVPWRGTTHIRNITFDDNDVIRAGGVFSIYPFGGTNVEAVTYRNSRIEETTEKPFEFLAVDCTSWGPQNCGQPVRVLGYVRNVRVDNVTFGNLSPQPSMLRGYSASADVRGVYFNNLRIGGTLVMDARGARLDIVGPYVTEVVFASSH
ncbi:MAG TPA: glycosyl hydrolase family 28-related protein [Methylomirabilota bacterium]|nr:glycosyl hydrolase family 28-related protein [Methylomirabilota bacterium]